MKNLFTLLFVLHLSVALMAQESAGIQFEHLSWEETLKKAEAEDKLIFVDAYTTWCGPCKWMSANVFPEQKVGDYYNAQFVNLKLDMEKGEGIEFAKKYKVSAFPTLLFIDGSGELMHQSRGSRDPDAFIALGEAANDPNRQAGALKRKYDAGERSPEFLRNFAIASNDSGIGNAEEIANTYLATQKDWNTPENLKFIYELTPYDNMDHKLFQYIADNKETFYAAIGKEDVNGKLKTGVLYSMMRKRVNDKEQVKEAYGKIFPELKEQYADEWEMNNAMRARTPEQRQKFMELAVQYFDKYEADSWNMYNSVAWTFYEMTEDVALLEKAKVWAEKSVALESNYYNNDTAAAICLKLKNKKDGIKYANEAIRLAKEEGSDYKETQKLLEQLNTL